jgi:uncharacterized membrane protein
MNSQQKSPRSLLSLLASTFLNAGYIGAGLGLFLGLLSIPELAKFSSNNQLPVELRWRVLGIIAGCLVSAVLLTGVVLLFRRGRPKTERMEFLVRALLPLGWTWPAPLFFDWEVFRGNGLLRVLLALLWAVGLERSLRSTFQYLSSLEFRVPARLRLKESVTKQVKRFGPHLFTLATLALVIWFSIFCARYTVMQHHRMGTSGFDLGIFDNLFYNLLDGEFFRGGVDADNRGGNHLQFHANFLAYLFVPVYALSPRAETLLILQAWVVGFSAIPLYLLTRLRLKSEVAAFVIAFVYLSHEALQGPIFYEFHFLTMSSFFICWTLYFFERGSRWMLALTWLCAVLLREDQGAVLGAAGLVYLLMGKRPLLAAIGIVAGVAWLAVMRFVIMPLQAADGAFQQHIGIFQAMVAPGDHGFGGVLKTIITNPIYTLNNMMEARKFEYVLLLGVPFALLPFRSPRLLFLFAPATLFTLCTANYPPPVSKGFQYTMYWMPLLALGAVLKIDEWRVRNMPQRVKAAVLTMFIVGGALGYNGGSLYQQNSFTGGFRRVVFEITDAEKARLAELRSLIAKIPPRATLTATEAVVPHVSNRPDAHTLRQGIGNVEYLLLWKQELYGGEQPNHLIAELGTWPDQRYGLIEQTPNFLLFRRGAPTTDNVRALKPMGHYKDLRDDGSPRRSKRVPRKRAP